MKLDLVLNLVGCCKHWILPVFIDGFVSFSLSMKMFIQHQMINTWYSIISIPCHVDFEFRFGHFNQLWYLVEYLGKKSKHKDWYKKGSFWCSRSVVIPNKAPPLPLPFQNKLAQFMSLGNHGLRSSRALASHLRLDSKARFLDSVFLKFSTRFKRFSCVILWFSYLALGTALGSSQAVFKT